MAVDCMYATGDLSGCLKFFSFSLATAAIFLNRSPPMMVISDPGVDDPKRGFPLYGHMGILRVAPQCGAKW